ncbi:hypothetical protein LSH36_321g05048 [Paralvinella palmiformis]|uniref:Uncharacterized protein n=1 Tax=Paralvinella palmiformis TaxID=53620 RepID=A0AAD9N0Y1_9ANNE|nr:hypothetical protein LSH36_321g05048 [Paralvinella palmiformis]
MMALDTSDDLWNGTADMIGNANFTGQLINDTGNHQRSPGIHGFRDPPTQKLFWKVGIIFVISGLVIIGSFVVLFGFSYTRRRFSFRRYRRRHPDHVLAFENQLQVTGDEILETSPNPEDDQVTVHQSCSSGLRRWSRDDDMPRPRSRSNSRSRSLSPGAGSQPRSGPKTGQHDLDDDLINKGLQRLDNVRLAFKDDSTKYTEYDSTKDRMDPDA